MIKIESAMGTDSQTEEPLFIDGESACESPDAVSPMSRYIAWVKPFKWRLMMILIVGLSGVLIGILQPLAMRFLVDSIVLESSYRDDEKLILSVCVGLLVLLLTLTSSMLTLIGRFSVLNLSVRILASVRKHVFANLLILSLPALERLTTGGVSNRLINDTREMSSLLENMIVTPVVLGVRVVVTFFLIFWVNWRLALFALLLVPFSLGLSYFVIRRIRPLAKAMLRELGQLMGQMTELFRGIRVLKIYNREAREKLNFAHDSNLIARLELSVTKMREVMRLGWMTMISLTGLVIICVGSVLSIKGYATIGDIFALSLYTAFILQPTFGLVNAISDSKKSQAALDRVCEVLVPIEDEKSVRRKNEPLPECIHKIEFQSVFFGYELGVPVLKNINFKANEGETVALVGKSGSGKSTLIDLLSRFYSPDKGRILLNGVDVKEFSLSPYRMQIAIVEQEVTLFDGTIGENIAYAKPLATKREIEEAALKADAHDFIVSQPSGYESMVGENGRSLSGGEKQRISIARAFLANPKILILDEATSSLDGETERSVQQSLESLRKDRITFVIAHRLSTIRSADKIVVLEDGEIVEMGSHKELIAVRGRYFTNVMSQTDILDLPVDAAF